MERIIRFRAFDGKEMTTRIAVAGNGHVTTWYEEDSLVGPRLKSVDWHVMQFTGLMDKNGKEIYEGDILRWYTLDIEYQTHTGDNIPNGSYTEPCGTKCRKYEQSVIFRDAMFTCAPPHDPEEEEYPNCACPIQYPNLYDRKELNNIFYPRPYYKQHEVLTDEEFLEAAQSVADELGFECQTIEAFIQNMNGFEVIGNICEHKNLLQP